MRFAGSEDYPHMKKRGRLVQIGQATRRDRAGGGVLYTGYLKTASGSAVGILIFVDSEDSNRLNICADENELQVLDDSEGTTTYEHPF